MAQNAEDEYLVGQALSAGIPSAPPPPPPLPSYSLPNQPSTKPYDPSASTRPPSNIFPSKEARSAMASRFNTGQQEEPVPTSEDPEFQPGHFFFYGSLMDIDVLQAVTRASVTPTLQKAWIDGFRTKMWGIYPTIIPADSGRVYGMAWKVEENTTSLRLQRYETNAYKPCECTIHMENGEVLDGCKTFGWAGDKESPQLEDGVFDFERYQKYFKPSSIGKRSE